MKGILLDTDGEVIIEHGTMKIGDVDAQIAEHVVTAFRGEYKEAPMIGGAVRNMLNGTPDPFWAGDVKKQLQSQGVNADVSISEGKDVVVNLK